MRPSCWYIEKSFLCVSLKTDMQTSNNALCYPNFRISSYSVLRLVYVTYIHTHTSYCVLYIMILIFYLIFMLWNAFQKQWINKKNKLKSLNLMWKFSHFILKCLNRKYPVKWKKCANIDVHFSYLLIKYWLQEKHVVTIFGFLSVFLW